MKYFTTTPAASPRCRILYLNAPTFHFCCLILKSFGGERGGGYMIYDTSTPFYRQPSRYSNIRTRRYTYSHRADTFEKFSPSLFLRQLTFALTHPTPNESSAYYIQLVYIILSESFAKYISRLNTRGLYTAFHINYRFPFENVSIRAQICLSRVFHGE